MIISGQSLLLRVNAPLTYPLPGKLTVIAVTLPPAPIVAVPVDDSPPGCVGLLNLTGTVAPPVLNPVAVIDATE